ADAAPDIVFLRQQAEYEKICASHQAITDFRAKLLGFLPLATGAGIFLLLGNPGLLGAQPAAEAGTSILSTLPDLHVGVFVGLFGILVTIGLFVHELFGIQYCLALITRGQELERAMQFRGGQFRDMGPGLLRDYLGPKGAAITIYSTVCAAWAFVAAASAVASVGQVPARLTLSRDLIGWLQAVIAVSPAIVAGVTFLLVFTLGLLLIEDYTRKAKAIQPANPAPDVPEPVAAAST
ncbi:MAG TPA: hypothetical protein VGE04_10220, partial [Chloroflexia bacterium]